MSDLLAFETACAQSADRSFRQTLLLACEDPDQFQQLLDEYMAAYQPANLVERHLVEHMFAAVWRILRIKMMETALLNHEMVHPDTHIAAALRALAEPSRKLPLLTLYESRLNRIRQSSVQTLFELRRSVT